MQTTFLWFRSNATGLYFDILDNIELIICIMIILTTIITCFLLLLTNELKKVIKEISTRSLINCITDSFDL